jgi:hypothetical protein
VQYDTDIASVDFPGNWVQVTFNSSAQIGVPYDFLVSYWSSPNDVGPDQAVKFTLTIQQRPIVVQHQHLSGPYSAFQGQLVASGGDGPLQFRVNSTPGPNVSVFLLEDGSFTLYSLNGDVLSGSFTVDVTDGDTTETFTVSWTFTHESPGPTYGTVSPGNGGSDSDGTSGGDNPVDAREGSTNADDESSAPSDVDDPDQDTGRGSETCGRCN